jgi:hypothetical protein
MTDSQPDDTVTFDTFINHSNITFKLRPNTYFFSPSTGKVYIKEYGMFRELKLQTGGSSYKITAQNPNLRIYVNRKQLREQLGFSHNE